MSIPPFSMTGNGRKNKHGQSIDLITELCFFSKPEQFAFKKLIEKLKPIEDSREPHNQCTVRIRDMTSGESQSFKKGIKLLIDKGLVKRVQKEHYLINPNLIISQHYKDDLYEWDELD